MSVNIADTLGRIGKGFWLLFAKDAGMSDGRDVETVIKEIEAIAKGRNKGYVFDTKDGMDTQLADAEFTKNLLLGDNLYIREVNVPDFWWDGTKAQQLETQKVDLSEYLEKARGVENKGKYLVVDEDGNVTEEAFDLPISEEDNNALQKMEDGSYFVPKIASGRDVTFGYSKYSEEEECIGVHTDGKPLYRKVIRGTYSTSGTAMTVPNGNANVEQYIRLEGFVNSAANVNVPFNTYNGTSTYVLAWGRTVNASPSDSILLSCYNTIFTNRPFIIIIEYTKTTDAPNSFTPDMITKGKAIIAAAPHYDNYSEEEIIIGKYIDGKPLYRKVIETTDLPKVTTSGTLVTTSLSISDLNVDYTKSIQGSLLGINNLWTTMPLYFQGGSYKCEFYSVLFNGSNIVIRNNRSDWTTQFIKARFIIEYTKTTDEPNSFDPSMITEDILIDEASEEDVADVVSVL